MKMKARNEEEKKRDAEYHAFCKTDAFLFEQPSSRIILYPGALIMPIRLFIGWSSVVWIVVTDAIVATVFGTYGKTPDHQGELQKKLVRLINKISGYVILFGLSCIHTSFSRPTICYKKYLGPDWKPSYEGTSSYVANHTSYTDVFVIMMLTPAAFIAKAGTRDVPLVGAGASAMGSLYIDRASREGRDTLVE